MNPVGPPSRGKCPAPGKHAQDDGTAGQAERRELQDHPEISGEHQDPREKHHRRGDAEHGRRRHHRARRSHRRLARGSRARPVIDGGAVALHKLLGRRQEQDKEKQDQEPDRLDRAEPIWGPLIAGAQGIQYWRNRPGDTQDRLRQNQPIQGQHRR